MRHAKRDGIALAAEGVRADLDPVSGEVAGRSLRGGRRWQGVHGRRTGSHEYAITKRANAMSISGAATPRPKQSALRSISSVTDCSMRGIPKFLIRRPLSGPAR